ncbi:MAG: dephospho-CoA kinase [Vicinamibacteria bacterium]|nr:dephospho-CoA kinase [Vicinamibacteria bacterium]
MLRVGLTGGIACGKSRVLERLGRAGCHSIDLDEVSHAVMASGGSAHAEVVATFGDSIVGPDGGVDRRALAAIVFSDESARLRLNAIVHPHVRAEEERRVDGASVVRDAVIVTDGALLIEGGAHLRYDRLIVVHCAPEIQIDRLMRREGMDRGRALDRVAAQMSQEEKRRFASFEVETTGNCALADRRIEKMVERLFEISAARRSSFTLSLARAIACLGSGPTTGPADLRPLDVMNEIEAAGVVDLMRLARRMRPPHDGPWYTAARNEIPKGPGPEALTAPLVVWILARGRADRERVVAAAASLARLTHRDSSAIAGACLFAEALFEAATGDRGGHPESWTCWKTESEKWGGGAPPPRVVHAVNAAWRHMIDAGAAVSVCARIPHAAELAACVVALRAGDPSRSMESIWSAPLRRVGLGR